MARSSEEPSVFQKFLAGLIAFIQWLFRPFSSLFSSEISASVSTADITPPPPVMIPFKGDPNLLVSFNKLLKKIEIFRRYRESSSRLAEIAGAMISQLETAQKYLQTLSAKDLKSLEKDAARLEKNIEETSQAQKLNLKVAIFEKILDLQEALDKLPECDEKQKIAKEITEMDAAIKKENELIEKLSAPDKEVAYTDRGRDALIRDSLMRAHTLSCKIQCVEIELASKKHAEEMQRKRDALKRQSEERQTRRDRELAEARARRETELQKANETFANQAHADQLKVKTEFDAAMDEVRNCKTPEEWRALNERRKNKS